MRCPHCGHSDGIHSGPTPDGLTVDGHLMAPDYAAGRCHQGDCQCPGWFPETSEMELVAATLRARVVRAELAEAPWALRPVIGRRSSVQGELF